VTPRGYRPEDSPADERHCDACSGRLTSGCHNVLFEGMVERLVIGQPEPDRVGAVVVRYHHVCYPKNLLEVLARMRAKRQSTMAEPLRNEDMSSVHVL